MNYCPKCGRQVSPEDNVCGGCGNPLREPQPPKRMSSREAKHDMRPILIVGIVAVLVIALLGCVLIITLGFREPETPVETVPKAVQIEEVISNEDTGKETAPVSPTAAPLTEIPYYVTGVSNQIKVRSEADTDSPVVTKLENGDSVKLLDNRDQVYWRVRVEDEQVEGYIDSRYLTDEQLAVISPREMYVSGVPAYLTLASTNGADYSEVGRAYNGDRVTVLSEPEGELWYVYVETLRSYGYVLKDYLGDEKPTPTPAPTATPTPQSTAPAAITNYNMYVTDVEYYLALRSEKAYSASNELGKLYNGETVEVVNDTTGDYWYVYAPTLGKYGYVNADYLTSRAPAPTTYHTGGFWTVADVTYYLALRSQPSYDGANELGKLYNGERVKVIDTLLGDYWYVYAPTLDMYGYVNSAYLQ